MGLLDEIGYVLVQHPSSSFSGIIPHVVIQEGYQDDLAITDHPVERGAAITDHSFKRPSVLEMRCGFSNSTAGDESFIARMYAQLLALQGSRKLFEVYTPRRRYKNMLMAGLHIVRDQKANSVLSCGLTFREVIITQTQTASTATSQTNSTDTQASPQKTGAEADTGTKQPTGAETVSSDTVNAEGGTTTTAPLPPPNPTNGPPIPNSFIDPSLLTGPATTTISPSFLTQPATDPLSPSLITGPATTPIDTSAIPRPITDPLSPSLITTPIVDPISPSKLLGPIYDPISPSLLTRPIGYIDPALLTAPAS